MILKRNILTAAVALLVAIASQGYAQHADLAVDEVETDQPIQRRFLMEDSYGNVVTNEDLSGYFVLIIFGYTGCPDVCPTTLAVVADAVDMLDPNLQDRLKVLFVTVDPDRDTAKVLREYVGFFDKEIMALRGPKAYTDHMVKVFNARYEIHAPDPADPDVYAVDHTASVAFMGPDGTLIKRLPYNVSVEAMADDIRMIVTECLTSALTGQI